MQNYNFFASFPLFGAKGRKGRERSWMKPLLWAKRSIAALLCFGVLLSAPGAALAGTAAEGFGAARIHTPRYLPEGDFVMPETTPAPHRDPPPHPPDLTATPGAPPNPRRRPPRPRPRRPPRPPRPPTPASTSNPPPRPPTPTETPAPAAHPHPRPGRRPAGRRGADLCGPAVENRPPGWGAKRCSTTAAGRPGPPLTMSGGERGLYTVTVPAGGLRTGGLLPGPAGRRPPTRWAASGSYALSQSLDGSAAPGAEAVTFSAGSLSAFYYDSGDNPSYWAPPPTMTPPSTPSPCWPPVSTPAPPANPSPTNRSISWTCTA